MGPSPLIHSLISKEALVEPKVLAITDKELVVAIGDTIELEIRAAETVGVLAKG